MVRRELPDVRIECIPGASAVTSLYSIAGVPGNQFTFLGFVPHKKGRQTFFWSVAENELPVIFYESPHRIMKTLESLTESLPPDRLVIVGRELTKLHEEVIRGTAADILEYFKTNPEHERGEFVLLVAENGSS
jgi:16S rRNA (cytidine1402-2'-O)-methyltransferase